MAQRLTNAQIQTVLGMSAANLKPYHINSLYDALQRTKHVENPDSQAGATESTLAVIFPSGGVNP